ncbi:MAG: 23S rRNA (guanosine(2251)-2'-O)-methyltransferase RlmB [Steroidobacteraceae bacterium]
MTERSERIYGWHPVKAFLARHPDRVRSVRIAAGREDPRVREVESAAARHGVAVARVGRRELDRLLGDVAHQGVMAEIAALPNWTESDLLEALVRSTDPLLLLLDGVQDPHNLGACLRTVDACGALAVVVPKDRAAQLTPAVRKVAAGGAESTPVVAVTNLARTLKLLKEAGLWVVGADAAAAQRAQDADLKGPLALVLGAEGAGLRQLTRDSCDFLVALPQRGTVESLNVSVAAGMLLYEALRQRQPAR